MPSTKKMRKRRMKRYEHLRKAVNAYLRAQNATGYQHGDGLVDGNSADEARRELCKAVYPLNEEKA